MASPSPKRRRARSPPAPAVAIRPDGAAFCPGPHRQWRRGDAIAPQPPLAIDPHLGRIGRALLTHRLIAVSADTGSGKSLGIPRLVGAVLGLRVIVAIPTVVAAKALYRRQCAGAGVAVGYAADSIVRYDAATRIVYCTTGHLREALLGDRLGFDVIMLDEAHVRDVSTYLVTSLVAQHLAACAARGATPPRVIVASATLEADYIARRLPGIHAIDLHAPSPHPIAIAHCGRDYDLYGSGGAPSWPTPPCSPPTPRSPRRSSTRSLHRRRPAAGRSSSPPTSPRPRAPSRTLRS